MRHFLWIFILLFGAAVAEGWAGGTGWALPALAVTAFYLMQVFGWRRPLLLGLFAGAIIDLGFGRPYPLTPLLVLPAIAGLATLWHRSGSRHSLAMQMLPGALCGLIQAGVILAADSFAVEPWFWRLFLHNTLLLLALAGEGMLLLPLLCLAYDHWARRLALPQYLTLHPPSGRPAIHVA
ncbi:MAG: hypothetical protein WC789_05095 [Lentisphaeria bacterium]|jgi:hypothetical protein